MACVNCTTIRAHRFDSRGDSTCYLDWFGKLLLALASTIILSSESRGTHGHILLSHDFVSRATLIINVTKSTE
jgi:hypothetical protein